MQALYFRIKRSYHTTYWRNRRLLDPMEITPARLEALYLLRRRADWQQRRICQELGVTGATVSRMLKFLEHHGLIARERCSCDRRRKLVRITRLGMHRLRRVTHRYFRHDRPYRDFEKLFCPRKGNAWTRFLAIEEFESRLLHITRALGDYSWGPYRWHPED